MKSKKPSTGLTQTSLVVINDSSCLIDLRKAGLIEAMLRLPFRFVVAFPLIKNELLDIGEEEWQELTAAGLEVIDLNGNQVSSAYDLKASHGALSAEDCFSIVLAREQAESVLLTGDAHLKKVSERMGIEVHGVLWIADLVSQAGIVTLEEFRECLTTWRKDATVFIHSHLIDAMLEKCA